jgi:putative ABC transport system permease protein
MPLFPADLKHASRVLTKAPAFALAAIVVLALGIGVNTAIFSIVHAVLLRPLPYAKSEQLVQLWHTPPQKQFPGVKTFSLSAANYLDWEQQNTVFEQSAVYGYAEFRLTAGAEARQVAAARVEPTFFSVLQVKPLLGRAIVPGDDEGDRANGVVLSHKLWQTDFGGDPAVVGKQIRLDGRPRTVIGVMPADFEKPEWALLWTPLVWEPVAKAVRGEHSLSAVARLKPAVSVAEAQSQLNTIAARLALQYPADNAGWGAKVVPLREETVGDVRRPLLILLGAVLFVLLIACANVANLTLARALDRGKEIAIRTAIGARRFQILRQLLTESVLLSLIGAALGLVVAHFGMQLVVAYFGSSLPRVGEIKLDAPVLAFTFVVALFTGAAAGVAPAWRMSRSQPNDALKQGLGRTDVTAVGHRTRRALVVVEVALSLVLLVGAGLLIRTLWNLRNVYPGFQPQHVLTMTVGVAANDFTNEEQQATFYMNVLRRVRALPAVEAAGLVDSVPLEGGSMQPIAVEGNTAPMAHQPEVAVRLISTGYLSAMRIPVLRGRDFADTDRGAAPGVVIVSEAMAKQFWPNQDPIGKRLTMTFFPEHVREVIGVVGNIKDTGLDNKDPVSTLYWPITQFYWPKQFGSFRSLSLQLAVRTATDPASAGSTIRAGITAVSPSTPVYDVRTMEDRVSESISPQRFNMFLLGAFAGLALLLATVGIYSVLAYTVRQRVHEIGIRVAMGAQSGDVLRLLVFEGIRPTLLGVGIGLAVAVALSRVLATLVFGVRAIDVPTFLTGSIILVGLGFVASLIPAYRATRVDALQTLRSE